MFRHNSPHRLKNRWAVGDLRCTREGKLVVVFDRGVTDQGVIHRRVVFEEQPFTKDTMTMGCDAKVPEALARHRPCFAKAVIVTPRQLSTEDRLWQSLIV